MIPNSQSSPKPVDLNLLAVLQQMVANLTDTDSHYMVSANFFDFVDSERQYKRHYMSPIYVHQDSVSNIDFDERGILLDTFFSPENGTVAERIHILYDQIYQVAQSPTGGMFMDEDNVYTDRSKFKMPPLH